MADKRLTEWRELLDEKVAKYNTCDFITNDPISIPKQYTLKQDIEITAFWTALLSWGQRPVIISKARELFALMGNEPYRFIMEHGEKDLKGLLSFRHRTFQADDTLYFLHFLQSFYRENASLESVFYHQNGIEQGLIQLHHLFTRDPLMLPRTAKHLSSPSRNTACKRLNMFLRWMVRKDDMGVDFGIWDRISMADLMIPLDVHVGKISRALGMLTRKNDDWKSVVELTGWCRLLDPADPVKYDYALFSMGLGREPG